MKNKRKVFKTILQFIGLVLVVGYFATSLVQSTFASNIDKKPNVIITINSKGDFIQEGSLFDDGFLYPSTVEDVEKGIGGVSGVIRINNQYGQIKVSNLGLGIKEDELIIDNNYPRDVIYNSFLDNIKLKVEKGTLFSFNKTLVDYANLRSFLYEPNNEDYRGFTLDSKDSFVIGKGDTIDLKYTLHMVEETGEELEAVTAFMPIYINVHENPIIDDGGNDDDKDDDDDRETISSSTQSIETHWAHDCIITLLNHKVIVGFPHESMTIEDYRNGIVAPEVYVQEAVLPDRYITRAEAAMLVGKALGLEEDASLITGYVDSIPSWARGYIITTSKENIFKGYPFKLFKPDKYITREEMIAVLTRAYEIKLENKDIELTFKDKEEISHWALESVKAGFEKEVVVGYPDNTYKPKNNITRGEAFTIICKLMGLHEEHTEGLKESVQ